MEAAPSMVKVFPEPVCPLQERSPIKNWVGFHIKCTEDWLCHNSILCKEQKDHLLGKYCTVISIHARLNNIFGHTAEYSIL